MLHANVGYKSRYDVYFSSMAPLLRLGTLQNSHCAALPDSISAYVSFGQFLLPLPQLAPQSTTALCHSHHIISMFGHCVSTLVLCSTSREKPRYNALLELFLLDLS